MAFQKQVGLYTAKGVAGGKATPDQSVYTPVNYMVEDEAGICAGGFAFRGSEVGLATAEGGSSETLLGFVERVINYSIYDVTVEGTLRIPQYGALTIAVKGDYYVTAPATVAVGDDVTVDETGAIVDGGSITTGWKYHTAGDEGEVVIISGWTIGGTSADAGTGDPSTGEPG